MAELLQVCVKRPKRKLMHLDESKKLSYSKSGMEKK